MLGVSKKKLLTDLRRRIQDGNVFNGAAALAFFLILSIFSAVVFLLNLFAYLPVANLQTVIMDFLHQVLPEKSASLFEGVVKNVASQKQGEGGLLAFSILFAIWWASRGMYGIMHQLNITYNIEEKRPFWKSRSIALLLMLLFVLLVLGAFALVILGGIFEDRLINSLGFGGFFTVVFSILWWLIITIFLLLFFSLIYYFGPDAQQNFLFLTPGSVVGVIMLVLASLGFLLYISAFREYEATYGNLGGVILLMLWLYEAGVAILIGAEINILIGSYRSRDKSDVPGR